jgi:hypothetical protein
VGAPAIGPTGVPLVCEVRLRHRHADLVDAAGRRSGCQGELRPNRQYERERRDHTARWWKCEECGGLVTLDERSGLVTLDTSRVADFAAR